MPAAVACPACGAKIKVGRPSCLRCGEKLEAAVRQAPGWLAELAAGRRGPLLAAGVVLSLLLLLVVADRQREMTSQPAIQTAAASTPAPVKSGEAQAAVSPTAPRGNDEPQFLDSGRAGAMAYARGDFATALARYKEAAEKNPQDVESLNNAGLALGRMGRPAEAIPYFERAIALNTKKWASRFNLAHAYGQLGDWPRAVTEYRTAADLFPEDYVTHYNLAMALHKANQEEPAVAEFQRAIALAPGEPSFRLSLGISFERLNRPLEAARVYEEYLELAPTAPDAAKVKTRIEVLKNPV